MLDASDFNTVKDIQNPEKLNELITKINNNKELSQEEKQQKINELNQSYYIYQNDQYNKYTYSTIEDFNLKATNGLLYYNKADILKYT